MIIYKFIKNGKEYFIDEFEKKYPFEQKIVSNTTGQAISVIATDGTCDNHTSFLIENHDNKTFYINWCCENHK